MDRNREWTERFKIGDWPRWDYDHERSQLTFSAEGRVRIVADIVVVGTVDKDGSRWEWSWGNPNFPAHSRESMEKIKEFGEEKDWAKLTSLFLDNDDHLGWELSSIAAHILNAEGTYRCPDDEESGNFIYLVAFNTRFVN